MRKPHKLEQVEINSSLTFLIAVSNPWNDFLQPSIHPSTYPGAWFLIGCKQSLKRLFTATHPSTRPSSRNMVFENQVVQFYSKLFHYRCEFLQPFQTFGNNQMFTFLDKLKLLFLLDIATWILKIGLFLTYYFIFYSQL